MILILEVCIFPPFRQTKGDGWGTELVEIHTARDLGMTLRENGRFVVFHSFASQ
jgi:hypothetical protein